MTDSSKTKHVTIALVLLALIVFLDQGTKWWIDKNLPIREVKYLVNGREIYAHEYIPLPGRDEPVGKIKIVSGFFYIEHAVNKGAAWGILHGRMNLLTVISLLALAAMLYYFRRICENYGERVWGLGLLMGGTAGNLIDRMNLIERGHGIRGVVDFISIKYWPGHWWPAFNVADMAICGGVFLLCISTFLRPDKDGKRSPLAEKIIVRFSPTKEQKPCTPEGS